MQLTTIALIIAAMSAKAEAWGRRNNRGPTWRSEMDVEETGLEAAGDEEEQAWKSRGRWSAGWEDNRPWNRADWQADEEADMDEEPVLGDAGEDVEEWAWERRGRRAAGREGNRPWNRADWQADEEADMYEEPMLGDAGDEEEEQKNPRAAWLMARQEYRETRPEWSDYLPEGVTVDGL